MAIIRKMFGIHDLADTIEVCRDMAETLSAVELAEFIIDLGLTGSQTYRIFEALGL